MSRDVIALVGLQCAINYRRVEHIVGFLPLQYMKTKSSLLRQTPQSSNQPSIARAQVSLSYSLFLQPLFMIVNAHKVQSVVNFPNYAALAL